MVFSQNKPSNFSYEYIPKLNLSTLTLGKTLTNNQLLSAAATKKLIENQKQKMLTEIPQPTIIKTDKILMNEAGDEFADDSLQKITNDENLLSSNSTFTIITTAMGLYNAIIMNVPFHEGACCSMNS